MALRVWCDAEVRRYTGGALTHEQAMARLEQEMTNQQNHDFQFWPVFTLERGEFIGACGFRPWKPEQNSPEFGFGFFPEYWRQGYATEAGRAAIAHAFGALGAAALFAGHHPENDVSRHVLKKLGFEYTHDEFYGPTGQMHPSYLLSAERHRAME